MALRRREVLRLGGAALSIAALGRVSGSFAGRADAAQAAPEPTPADDQTAAALRELIVRRAIPSTNPWVLMHVVLAFGRDVKQGSTPLLDDVIAGNVKQSTIDGVRYDYFERKVEAHPNHFLQILQATEVPYDRVFQSPIGKLTRRDLVAGATGLFDPQANDDEQSWTISAFTADFPPDHSRFTTARKVQVDVADLVEAHCRDTEAAYADTFAAMQGTKPYRRGVLQTKACNGTHLVYGLIDALRAGYRGHDLRPRVEKIIDATLFRVAAEPALIDASLAQRTDPLVRLNADAAKFTFLGHVLEDLGYAVRRGVLTLDAKQRATIDKGREMLSGIVERLTGEYDLDGLSVAVPEAYKLILGDSCHALRGWRFWL